MKNQLKYFIILAFTVVFSCRDDAKIDDDVLPQEKLIEVITEMELAQALVILKSSGNDTINEQDIYNEVYANFDTSQDQFNKSLEFYCKEPVTIIDIYGKVIENLSKKTRTTK